MMNLTLQRHSNSGLMADDTKFRMTSCTKTFAEVWQLSTSWLCYAVVQGLYHQQILDLRILLLSGASDVSQDMDLKSGVARCHNIVPI